MKRSVQITCILVVFAQAIFSQAIPKDSLYFGQTLPGSVPKVFAPGIVTLPNRDVRVITFSPDGKMCFFWDGSNIIIYFAEYKDNKWTTPQAMNSKFRGEPSFSLDGKKIYLNSKQAINQVGYSDICYSERTGATWSDPISLGSPLNSSNGQWHACIVADSSIYFTSENGSICRSQYKNGIYQPPVFLPYPINGFSGNTYGDPYVSPSESYIIFRSGRAGGYGNADIYISYKKNDGAWTNPKNLGDKINTNGEEYSGNITPDGKYMFYGSKGTLYWVKANFIDSLNDNPTNLINQILQQNIQVFPNPTKDKINVNFGTLQYKKAFVEITNISGKIISSETLHNSSTTIIDLTGKPKGVYILNLIIDGEKINKKIILIDKS
jgi:hypothetical protein